MEVTVSPTKKASCPMYCNRRITVEPTPLKIAGNTVGGVLVCRGGRRFEAWEQGNGGSQKMAVGEAPPNGVGEVGRGGDVQLG